jgi:hypothetical protein
MREQLNNNPIAQVGAVAVLLVVVAFLVISSMGGGGEAADTSASATSAEVPPGGSAPATAPAVEPTTGIPVEAGESAAAAGVPQVPAGPLPRRVTRAFAAGRTVVLLVVKRGGVDDGIAAASAVSGLATMRGVSVFVVPVDRIARYAQITQAVSVSQVPALVVVRPKPLDHGTPSASVSYGYQSPQSVVQAVVDARYKGRTLEYHP